MTLTKATNVKGLLDEAFSKINAGAQTIKEGCELYVQALDQDLESARKFMRDHGITDEFLDLFEAVGRGRIHPRLLVMPCPANTRLQRAPLAEQERLLSAGVELVEFVNGEAKVRIKPVSELTKLEAATALDSSGNVPRDVQIERLKRRVLGHTFKMPPYSLDGDILYARENSRIPFEELKRLYLEAHKYHEKHFIEIKGK